MGNLVGACGQNNKIIAQVAVQTAVLAFLGYNYSYGRITNNLKLQKLWILLFSDKTLVAIT